MSGIFTIGSDQSYVPLRYGSRYARKSTPAQPAALIKTYSKSVKRCAKNRLKQLLAVRADWVGGAFFTDWLLHLGAVAAHVVEKEPVDGDLDVVELSYGWFEKCFLFPAAKLDFYFVKKTHKGDQYQGNDYL